MKATCQPPASILKVGIDSMLGQHRAWQACDTVTWLRTEPQPTNTTHVSNITVPQHKDHNTVPPTGLHSATTLASHQAATPSGVQTCQPAQPLAEVLRDEASQLQATAQHDGILQLLAAMLPCAPCVKKPLLLLSLAQSHSASHANRDKPTVFSMSSCLTA